MQATPFFPAHWQAAARAEGAFPLDFGDVNEEYKALVTGGGLLDRSDCAKLLISGGDRFEWLQGQVTNDLRTLEEGGWIDFFVCAPTGQVVADCRLWDTERGYFIFTHGERREALLARLERMLVSEDVTIEDLTDSWLLLTLTGCMDLALPSAHPTNATRSFGRDVGVPTADAPALIDSLAPFARPVGASAYEIARIEDAIPVFGKDWDERTLPQELGPIVEASHISYSKGCYTGQEVIMRIHSRGHTNKSWVGLLPEAHCAAGDNVIDPVDGRQVGLVNSACQSLVLSRPIALATVPNDYAIPGSSLRLGSTAATVTALPFVVR